MLLARDYHIVLHSNKPRKARMWPKCHRIPAVPKAQVINQSQQTLPSELALEPFYIT